MCGVVVVEVVSGCVAGSYNKNKCWRAFTYVRNVREYHPPVSLPYSLAPSHIRTECLAVHVQPAVEAVDGFVRELTLDAPLEVKHKRGQHGACTLVLRFFFRALSSPTHTSLHCSLPDTVIAAPNSPSDPSCTGIGCVNEQSGAGSERARTARKAECSRVCA